MTSYINQTIARQMVAELIDAAERGRVRRQFRQARRESRNAARGSDNRSAGLRRTNLQWADRIWVASA